MRDTEKTAEEKRAIAKLRAYDAEKTGRAP